MLIYVEFKNSHCHYIYNIYILIFVELLKCVFLKLHLVFLEEILHLVFILHVPLMFVCCQILGYRESAKATWLYNLIIKQKYGNYHFVFAELNIYIRLKLFDPLLLIRKFFLIHREGKKFFLSAKSNFSSKKKRIFSQKIFLISWVYILLLWGLY